MYHHVSPLPGLVTVSPDTFRRQIEWLAHHDYRTVGCDALAGFLAGADLPEKSVVLTFDDGYLDNFVYAHPCLQAVGFKAVLFLVTGWLGDGPARLSAPVHSHSECMQRVGSNRADDVMLRWSEVTAMADAGTFEFHSHTHTHTRWDREIADPTERDRRLEEDLGASRRVLAERLGAASSHLCWPQGYNDAAYRRVAATAGFEHLYTVRKGTCTASTSPDAIPRVVVKDRSGGWFARRLWLYRHPALASAYLGLRGE